MRGEMRRKREAGEIQTHPLCDLPFFHSPCVWTPLLAFDQRTSVGNWGHSSLLGRALVHMQVTRKGLTFGMPLTGINILSIGSSLVIPKKRERDHWSTYYLLLSVPVSAHEYSLYCLPLGPALGSLSGGWGEWKQNKNSNIDQPLGVTFCRYLLFCSHESNVE